MVRVSLLVTPALRRLSCKGSSFLGIWAATRQSLPTSEHFQRAYSSTSRTGCEAAKRRMILAPEGSLRAMSRIPACGHNPFVKSFHAVA